MPYSKLTVTKIGDIDDRAVWELHEPLEWTNGVMRITVPAGFQCDFASIPQFALSILGDIGQEAGTIHDYLYREDAFVSEWMDNGILVTHQVSRGQADMIFFVICGEMGIEWWKRKVMYYAVRAGAKKHWRARKVNDPFIQQEVLL